MKMVLIAGARPNFMKIAPIIEAIDCHNRTKPEITINTVLVHTGQHYDHEMSRVFFEDLELPPPDIYLGVGSGTHSQQTGKIMIAVEDVLMNQAPDLVVVVGDVNSTLAGALASVKLHIPVAHVEAGLRSFDREMPEEINRILTDAISDYLFTHSSDADKNLMKEGISHEKIFFVGNVMADSLLYNKAKAEQCRTLDRFGLNKRNYALLTLHRPSNVDVRENMLNIFRALMQIVEELPIIFPVHPRTQQRLKEFAILNQLPGNSERLLLIEPLGYLDFLNLEINARFVITDSGGIQEETTVLGIPCLTLRNSTERPVTISQGTNTLVGNDTEVIVREALKIIGGGDKQINCPELWDGKAAERIVRILSRKESAI